MLLEREDVVYLLAPGEPEPQVRGALSELEEHLGKLGLKPVAAASPPESGKLVGLGVDRAGHPLAPPDVGPEGFRLWSADNDTVLIAASGATGILNGAYELLEKLGIRWLTPEATHFPDCRAWDLSTLDRSFEPSFRLRSLRTENNWDPDWAARHRLNFFVDHNQRYFQDDPRMAGSHHFAGPDHYCGGKHCHNFYELLCSGLAAEGREPPGIEQVFAEHPEYFTLLDGERHWTLEDANKPGVSNQSGQLCLTNPDVRRLLAAGVIRQLSNDPQAGLIGFSLRDNYHYCRCESCRAETERLGGFNRLFYDLANEVAAAVAAVHPDKLLAILAYHGTQKPPADVRLHSNLLVYYCPIRTSQYHAWDECEHNTRGGLNPETPPSMSRPIEQIARWTEICDHLVVWYYTLNLPPLHVHPNIRAHDRNLRLMRDLGVEGVFLEDNGAISAGALKPIRAYVLARLLWDPDRDLAECMDEFIRLYYGAAADLVAEYVRAVHDTGMWDWENWPGEDGVSKWESKDYEKACWEWFNETPREPYPVPHFFTTYGVRPPLKRAFFDLVWPLFAEMDRRAVDQPELRPRLDLLKPALYYVTVRYLPPDDRRHAEAAARLQPILDELMAIFKDRPKVPRWLTMPAPCWKNVCSS